jgi:hypothetical protein
MEKQKINIRPEKNIILDFQGNEIIIEPYIKLSNKFVLMETYLDGFFDETSNMASRYLKAKNSCILGIIDLQTNIDISNLNIDLVLGSKLWDAIKIKISNYEELETEINTVVKYILDQKSISVSFDRIALQISQFMDKISQLDLSKEGMAELFKTLDIERNKINEIVNPSLVPDKPKRKTKLQ